MHRGLFITRSGSGNLLNRYAISQGLFIFRNERNGCKRYVTRSGSGNLLNRYANCQGLFIFLNERNGCKKERAIHILKRKERYVTRRGSGNLLNRYAISPYSEMKGTVAKDMLHGADREIC